jgi:hypothetical protein
MTGPNTPNPAQEYRLMRNVLSALTFALALCAGPAAQAALVTFNNPSQIVIDPDTFVASYNEAGFTFSGAAASYLLLDGIGSGGSPGLFALVDNTLKLTASSGGLFSLQSLDFGLFDLQDTTPSPSLRIEGLLADSSLLSQTLGLGALANFGFTNWTGLQEVRFSGTANFVLDNVSTVPEPASLALVALGIAGVGMSRRRRLVAS